MTVSCSVVLCSAPAPALTPPTKFEGESTTATRRAHYPTVVAADDYLYLYLYLYLHLYLYLYLYSPTPT